MNSLSRHSAYRFNRNQRLSLSDAFELYRQRRALSRLDDRALDDIGLTRAEADAEANRRFFDFFRR